MANKKNSNRKSSSSSSKATRTAKNQAVKYAKNHKKGVAIAVGILVILLAAIIAFMYVFKRDTFNELWNIGKEKLSAYTEYTQLFYKDSTDDDAEGTNGNVVDFNDFKENSVNDEALAGSLEDIEEASGFSIHFLELGNKYTGDCTLIKCGDTQVLIDAGSRKSSATTIKSYIDEYFDEGDTTLDYVIATHAHQDHIAGFVGTGSGSSKTGILYQYSNNGYSIGTIIQFAGHNSTATIYNDYVTGVNYAAANGTNVYTALQCYNQTDGAQRSYTLGQTSEGTLTLNVLYNYYYDHTTSDENDYSVCVLLTYTPTEGDAMNFLFTGDLEGDGEGYLVDNNELPKVDLFKGGHHGSKTSSTEKLLKVIQPKNVAICCCAGSTEYTTNNDNTFPTQAFVDRIATYTANVYCTTLCTDYKNSKYESMNGNIVFYISTVDGDNKGKLMHWCSNNDTLLKDTDWFKSNRTTPTAWA